MKVRGNITAIDVVHQRFAGEQYGVSGKMFESIADETGGTS
jgi:hypothetical protein